MKHLRWTPQDSALLLVAALCVVCAANSFPAVTGRSSAAGRSVSNAVGVGVDSLLQTGEETRSLPGFDKDCNFCQVYLNEKFKQCDVDYDGHDCEHADQVEDCNRACVAMAALKGTNVDKECPFTNSKLMAFVPPEFRVPVRERCIQLHRLLFNWGTVRHVRPHGCVSSRRCGLAHWKKICQAVGDDTWKKIRKDVTQRLTFPEIDEITCPEAVGQYILLRENTMETYPCNQLLYARTSPDLTVPATCFLGEAVFRHGDSEDVTADCIEAPCSVRRLCHGFVRSYKYKTPTLGKNFWKTFEYTMKDTSNCGISEETLTGLKTPPVLKQKIIGSLAAPPGLQRTHTGQKVRDSDFDSVAEVVSTDDELDALLGRESWFFGLSSSLETLEAPFAGADESVDSSGSLSSNLADVRTTPVRTTSRLSADDSTSSSELDAGHLRKPRASRRVSIKYHQSWDSGEQGDDEPYDSSLEEASDMRVSRESVAGAGLTPKPKKTEPTLGSAAVRVSQAALEVPAEKESKRIGLSGLRTIVNVKDLEVMKKNLSEIKSINEIKLPVMYFDTDPAITVNGKELNSNLKKREVLNMRTGDVFDKLTKEKADSLLDYVMRIHGVIILTDRYGRYFYEHIPPDIARLLLYYQSYIKGKAMTLAPIKAFTARCGEFFSQRVDEVIVEQSRKLVNEHSIYLPEVRGFSAFLEKKGLDVVDHAKISGDVVDDFYRTNFVSYNAFFYRKLEKNARKIETYGFSGAAVSGADARVMAYHDIDESTKFWVKSQSFSLQTMFKDAETAEFYRGGSMVILRLAPQDYHRFHIPMRAVVGRSVPYAGKYYSVNPMAIRSPINVFGENKRVHTELYSDEFGRVAYVSIGATCVGCVVLTSHEGQQVDAGTEHGYMAFGGSTVLLLFQKGTVRFSPLLLKNTARNIETIMKLGNIMGHCEPKASSDFQLEQDRSQRCREGLKTNDNGTSLGDDESFDKFIVKDPRWTGYWGAEWDALRQKF